MKKGLLMIACCSAFLLVGCSTPGGDISGSLPYDQTKSRAWNILHQFYKPYMNDTGLRDTECPVALKGKLNAEGSMMLLSELTTELERSMLPQFNPMVESLKLKAETEMLSSSSSSVNALGMAAVVADLFIPSTRPEEFGAVLGYVPVEEARTPEEAVEVFAAKFQRALAKAFADEGSGFVVEPTEITDKYFKGRSYWRQVIVMHPEIANCVPSMESGYGKFHCGVRIMPRQMKEQRPVLLPEVLFGPNRYGWKMTYWRGMTNMSPTGNLEKRLAIGRLYVASAKYLPEGTYIWKRSTKGTSFIVESGRVNFFTRFERMSVP